MSFAEVGRKLEWRGQGVDEQGVCLETGKVLVSVDPRYFRPNEVELLVGDAAKAKRVLDWEPTYTLEALCSEMVKSDVELFRRNKLLQEGGHDVFNQYE